MKFSALTTGKQTEALMNEYDDISPWILLYMY